MDFSALSWLYPIKAAILERIISVAAEPLLAG